jgi:hypothetical protein
VVLLEQVGLVVVEQETPQQERELLEQQILAAAAVQVGMVKMEEMEVLGLLF